jgi:hypothetical protein
MLHAEFEWLAPPRGRPALAAPAVTAALADPLWWKASHHGAWQREVGLQRVPPKYSFGKLRSLNPSGNTYVRHCRPFLLSLQQAAQSQDSLQHPHLSHTYLTNLVN